LYQVRQYITSKRWSKHKTRPSLSTANEKSKLDPKIITRRCKKISQNALETWAILRHVMTVKGGVLGVYMALACRSYKTHYVSAQGKGFFREATLIYSTVVHRTTIFHRTTKSTDHQNRRPPVVDLRSTNLSG